MNMANVVLCHSFQVFAIVSLTDGCDSDDGNA